MAFRIPRCPEQVGAGCLGRLGLHRQVQVGSKVQVCKSVVVLLKSVERDFYLQETCTRTPGDFQVSPSSEGEHLKNSSHQDRNLVRLWRRVRVINYLWHFPEQCHMFNTCKMLPTVWSREVQSGSSSRNYCDQPRGVCGICLCLSCFEFAP